MIEMKNDQAVPFYRTMTPIEQLERAVSDYLHVSRNRHSAFLYSEFNYWPAEEMAWNRLEEALERVEKENKGLTKKDKPAMIDS